MKSFMNVKKNHITVCKKNCWQKQPLWLNLVTQLSNGLSKFFNCDHGNLELYNLLVQAWFVISESKLDINWKNFLCEYIHGLLNNFLPKIVGPPLLFFFLSFVGREGKKMDWGKLFKFCEQLFLSYFCDNWVLFGAFSQRCKKWCSFCPNLY